jgi:hypothetical protein
VTTVIFSGARISSEEGAEHRREAVANVDFGAVQVASARLLLHLESPCFPFSNWAELETPAGQRWPAECDAFDRKLTVSLDDPSEAEAEAGAGAPGLELVRAITPFGGPLELETDVTDIVNGLPGEHRLRVAIDTWGDPAGMVSGSRGAWLVSAALELTAGVAPRRVLAIQPLVFGDQLEVEAEPVTFTVPDGAGSARIDYRVTGHGAVADALCRGPAEEFCARTHVLEIDDEPLPSFVPWRNDCAKLCTLTDNDAPLGPAQYCAENPCGAVQSVRAPRANWCHGSETPPFAIEAEALIAPGQHQLTRTIRGLADGGLWTVSATYFAYE